MIKQRKIELLAPAKNMECGIEAINHGADAVYIGAPKFGARAAAGNSLEDIAALVAHAHLYNARIYVTVNTILKEEDAGDVGFVMHCFAGDKETAYSTIDAGGMISFTGVITFKSAGALRDVAGALSLEHLMIETDCPYMAPVPYRGRRNEPAFVVKIAECLALLYEKDLETVSDITTANALRFFRLEK